jgi:hypothetical protein
VEGYCYFTTDDGKFYIDIATGSDLSKRVCLNAYKADRLNCGQIGSSTNPVYFSSEGVPVATTYKLNTTVPADAKFTDTDTKVTSVSNHYTPSANSAAALSADASGGSAATWNST